MCLWIPDYSEDLFLIAWIIFKQKYLIVRLVVFSDRLYAQVWTFKGTEQKSYAIIPEAF